jgi:naphthalene 1,2-dioxygenase ferredoxin reductase component
MVQFTPEHSRPYSMASLCTDQQLEFHVRYVPDGRVSGYVFNQLKVGDSVRVSGPLGTAYLRTRHEGPMLCVAGGTGLAPILSILRGVISAGMQNPYSFVFRRSIASRYLRTGSAASSASRSSFAKTRDRCNYGR